MKPFLVVAAEAATTHTTSWIWPEGYEIIAGGIASVLVFGLLFWKAGPILKKGMAARTARIQKQLDDATAAKLNAEAEASRIRQAKGDIGAERARLQAEADATAQQLLIDGRARLAAEAADLEAKAEADAVQLASRSGDQLRVEIGQLAADAADRIVMSQLDDATQQDLIEKFIARVGVGR